MRAATSKFILLIFALFISSCSSETDTGSSEPTAAEPSAYAAQAANVTIHRDAWGVPHIHGKTDADVAYGLAWERRR